MLLIYLNFFIKYLIKNKYSRNYNNIKKDFYNSGKK